MFRRIGISLLCVRSPFGAGAANEEIGADGMINVAF
jgi:hypothetical protein